MMKFAKRGSTTLGTLLAGVFVFAAAHAHAEDDEEAARRERGRFVLALDVDYSHTIQADQFHNGGGGALRIGTQLNLILITLIPELTFDYHSYDADLGDTAAITTGRIGGRIRFLKILEPGIFGHVGIGHISGDPLYQHTGVALDLGATLDFTLLPLIDIGLHAAWNRVFGGYDGGVSYVTTGVHLALVL